MRKQIILLFVAALHVLALQAQTRQVGPPNAKSGSCYAEIFIPDQYETVTEMVQVDAGRKEKRNQAAVYEMRTEQVQVQPEMKRKIVKPARYEWVTKQEQVRPAQRIPIETPNEMQTKYERELVEKERYEEEKMPLQYKTKQRQELVRPASTRWERQRIPNCQGDQDACFTWRQVTVPAEYKLAEERGEAYCPEGYKREGKNCVRKVYVPAVYTQRPVPYEQADAQKKYRIVPAEYRTVRYQKLVEEASYKEIITPAEYKTLERQQLVQAEKTNTVWQPPSYQQVSRRKLIRKGGFTEWREVLCPEQMTPAVMFRVYNSLQQAGYDPGPVTEGLSIQAQKALTRYQQDRGLPLNHLDFDTLEALGIRFN